MVLIIWMNVSFLILLCGDRQVTAGLTAACWLHLFKPSGLHWPSAESDVSWETSMVKSHSVISNTVQREAYGPSVVSLGLVGRIRSLDAVYSLQVKDMMTKRVDLLDEISKMPDFVVALRPHTVWEKTPVKLFCTVQGNPRPIVKWSEYSHLRFYIFMSEQARKKKKTSCSFLRHFLYWNNRRMHIYRMSAKTFQTFLI